MASNIIGNSIYVTVTFADAAGAAVDTTGMRARYALRRSATAPQEVAVSGTGPGGLASARFAASAAGFYDYRFWRPGALPLAFEGEFDVLASGLGADPA